VDGERYTLRGGLWRTCAGHMHFVAPKTIISRTTEQGFLVTKSPETPWLDATSHGSKWRETPRCRRYSSRMALTPMKGRIASRSARQNSLGWHELYMQQELGGALTRRTERIMDQLPGEHFTIPHRDVATEHSKGFVSRCLGSHEEQHIG
jgi:hypothetical protein